MSILVTAAEATLLSTALSYAASFPDHTLLLERAPSAPFSLDAVEGSKRSLKRKRGAELAEVRAAASGETLAEPPALDPNQARLQAALSAGISSVRAARAAGPAGELEEAWSGMLEGKVDWISKGDERRNARLEVDWVGIQSRQVEGEQWDNLLMSEVDCDLVVEETLSRIVINDNILASASLSFSVPTLDVLRRSRVTLILPPASAFLLSDFSTWSAPSSGIASLGKEKGGWDLVVMDPPWPNASAARGGNYIQFDAYELFKLDLRALCGTHPALVAVWITNNPKYKTLVIDKLFKAWGVTLAGTSYWMKVTDGGEPVWRIDSTNRKCSEGLILGYYNPGDAPLPDSLDKIFISTPIGHSRKPVLIDLLRPHLLNPSDRAPNVLELFARTSLAGPTLGDSPSESIPATPRGLWMAVGNEAVKFNVLDDPEEGGQGWLRPQKAAEKLGPPLSK